MRRQSRDTAVLVIDRCPMVARLAPLEIGDAITIEEA